MYKGYLKFKHALIVDPGNLDNSLSYALSKNENWEMNESKRKIFRKRLALPPILNFHPVI